MVALFILLFTASAHAEGGADPYRVDVLKHNQASSAIVLSSGKTLERLGMAKGNAVVLSMLIGVAAGLGKEQLMDRKSSGQDMRSNMTGVSSAVLTFALVDF